MTGKEERLAQLDALKSADCVSTVTFCIDILNSGFTPYKTLKFDTMKECNAAYDKLEPVHFPAFLRKYAKVSF